MLSKDLQILMESLLRPWRRMDCIVPDRLFAQRTTFRKNQIKVSLMQLLAGQRTQKCRLHYDRICSLVSLVEEGNAVTIGYSLSAPDPAFNVLQICSSMCLCHVRPLLTKLPIDVFDKN